MAYEVSSGEWYRARRALADRRRIVIAVLLVVAMVPFAALELAVEEWLARIVVSFLCAVPMGALGLLLRDNLRRDDERLLQPDAVCLTDDDVEMVTDGRATTVRWSRFADLRATPEFWYLHIDDGHVLALPRRMFTSAQQAEIDAYFPQPGQDELQG
jgi:hypothetical protein